MEKLHTCIVTQCHTRSFLYKFNDIGTKVHVLRTNSYTELIRDLDHKRTHDLNAFNSVLKLLPSKVYIIYKLCRVLY